MASARIPPGMPPPPLSEFWRKAPHRNRASTPSSSSIDDVPTPQARPQTTSKVKVHSKQQQTWVRQTGPPRISPHHITFAPFPEPLPIIHPGGPSDEDMWPRALPRSFTAPIITLQPFVNNDVPPLAVYHICRICLRPRSARYHREHPIPLDGLPPPPGICRRCRVMSVEDVEKKDVTVESESNALKLGLRCVVPDGGYVSPERMQEMKSQKFLKTLSKDCRVEIKGEGLRRQNSFRVEKDGATPREKDVTYRYVMVRHRSVSRTRSPSRPPPAVEPLKRAVEPDSDDSRSISKPVVKSSVIAGTSVQVQPTIKPSSRSATSEATKLDKTSKAGRRKVVSVKAQSDARTVLKHGRSASASSRSVVKVQMKTEIPPTTQTTETEIRRIAREEIEHYRQAERKMEAHKTPFAHGRMVPVQRQISQVTHVPDAKPWKRNVSITDRIVEKEKIYATTVPRPFESKANHHDHEKQHVYVSQTSRNDGDDQTKTPKSQRAASLPVVSGEKTTWSPPQQPKWEETSEAQACMSGALPAGSSDSKTKDDSSSTSKTKSDFDYGGDKRSVPVESESGWDRKDMLQEGSAWQKEKVEEVRGERKRFATSARREAPSEKLYAAVSPWVDAQVEAQTTKSQSPPPSNAASGKQKSASQKSLLTSQSRRASEKKSKQNERHYEASAARRNGASSACSKTTTDRLYLNEDESEHKTSGWHHEAAELEQKSSSWREDKSAGDPWTTDSRWQGQRTSSAGQTSQGNKTDAATTKSRQTAVRSPSPYSLHGKTEWIPTKSSTGPSQTSRPSAASSRQQPMYSESGYMGGDAEYTYTVRTVTPLIGSIKERDFDQALHREYEKSEEYVRRRRIIDDARIPRDPITLPNHKNGHSLESNALSQATNATNKSRVSEAGTAGTDGTTRSVRFAKKVDFSPTPPGSEASSSQFRMIGGREGHSAAIQLNSTEYRAEHKQHTGLTTEDLRRGRSRSRETVRTRAGYDERFEIAGEMRYIPAPEGRRHDRHDSDDSGDASTSPVLKSQPLMRALSESPSRERLNEMLKADRQGEDRPIKRDAIGPYRMPDPPSSKPGSMDVDDGSYAATQWHESSGDQAGAADTRW